VVLERRGPIEAIDRSIALSRNAWLDVFLLLLVVYLITALPGMAVGMFALVGMGGVLMNGGNEAAMAGIQAAINVLSALVRSITIPFSMACTVLLYYDRRVRTEALDVQMMAESLGMQDPTAAGGYGAGGGSPQGGYAPGGYAPGGYAPQGYAPGGYAPQGNAPGGYGPGGQGGYGSGGYGAPQYPGAPEYPAGPAYPTSGAGYPGSPAAGGAEPPAPRAPGDPETPADPNTGSA
jgi:hypothetical protein